MQQNTVFPSLERILRLQDAHALTKRSDLCRVRAAGMMRPGMHVFERCTKPNGRRGADLNSIMRSLARIKREKGVW